jgi:hypothetical protein
MAKRDADRRATLVYLACATGLALGRLGLFIWINEQYVSHRLTETVTMLERSFYVETLISLSTGLSSAWTGPPWLILGIYGFLVVVVSYMYASPILLVARLVASE